MKKIKTALLALSGLAMLAVSCDKVMDTRPTESIDPDLAWSQPATAYAFMYDVYGNVWNGYYNTSNTGVWECRTPNMVGSGESWDQQGFNKEGFENTADHSGGVFSFGQVRKCNMLIEMPPKYVGKGLVQSDADELVGQGHLLRAIWYYKIARSVGKIMYVDKVLVPADTVNDAMKQYKLTANPTESYELIVADLEKAASLMSDKKVDGRMNKWAAYAMMSEVCLQAAAYTDDQTKRDIFLTKGIAAADQVMGQYGLHSDYGEIFNEKWPNAKNEIIFAIFRDYSITSMENTDMIRLCPNNKNDALGRSGGSPQFNPGELFNAWGRTYPTHNLADCYLTIDDASGKAVRWWDASQVQSQINIATPASLPDWALTSANAKVQHGTFVAGGSATTAGDDITSVLYGDRDKRFYDSYVYDQSTWYGNTTAMRLLGNLGRYANDNNFDRHITWTNYYLRKSVYNTIESGIFYYANKTSYHWPLLRAGRVLMNKAEMLLWQNKPADAVTVLNQTRTVHGNLPSSTASSLDEVWADYITERRVELAYENDYYWSVLRWGLHGGPANQGKTADQGAQWMIEKPTFIEISKDGSAFFVSTVTHRELDDFKFSKKRYLLPIPQGTLSTYPFLGAQNPGWE